MRGNSMNSSPDTILAYPYFKLSEKLELGRPESPTQNMLLFVDATADTCRQAIAKGWQVHNLLFSQTLIAENSNVEYGVISANIYGEWTSLISLKFDALYLGTFGSYVDDLGSTLTKFQTVLKAHAHLYATLPNCDYYQCVIDKSTRELLPWPTQAPLGHSYRKSELEALLEATELRIVSLVETMDSLFYNDNYTKWQHVNGIDCKVALSNNPDERKNSFIKSFNLTVSNASTEIITAANMVDGIDIDTVHTQIQSLLRDGQTSVVLGMLEKIVQSGRSNDMTHNLYGIYFYYLGENQKAYISFIDAIQLNAGVADYYLNLHDAAQKLGLGKEVIPLVQAAIPHHPGLQSVLKEITQ